MPRRADFGARAAAAAAAGEGPGLRPLSRPRAGRAAGAPSCRAPAAGLLRPPHPASPSQSSSLVGLPGPQGPAPGTSNSAGPCGVPHPTRVPATVSASIQATSLLQSLALCEEQETPASPSFPAHSKQTPKCYTRPGQLRAFPFGLVKSFAREADQHPKFPSASASLGVPRATSTSWVCTSAPKKGDRGPASSRCLTYAEPEQLRMGPRPTTDKSALRISPTGRGEWEGRLGGGHSLHRGPEHLTCSWNSQSDHCPWGAGCRKGTGGSPSISVLDHNTASFTKH